MGTSRKELFSKEQNELADLAKVLGHPARIAIIQYLETVDTCITGNIVDEIGLAQATISQHLKELKKAGLIQGIIEGASVNYCLNKEGIERARSLLQALLEFKSQNTADNCC
jgi:DNA-binding transcriptional ArsR family regulator